MPTPPQLTPEQRAAALEKAAHARKVRAEVKERLKMGVLSLPNLFNEADADPILAKLKVIAVIESLPGVGKVKAKRLMEELEIAESRRLGGLGAKQKAALLAKFASENPA
ncbi:MAG: integration host factor, actinobacterial type [Acidimicrobiia bacterium]